MFIYVFLVYIYIHGQSGNNIRENLQIAQVNKISEKNKSNYTRV